MKKVLIGLMIASLTNLSFAQDKNGNNYPGAVTLEPVVITPLVNGQYLNSVQDAGTPESVKNLEDEAVFYDIKKSPVYNKDYDDYTVFFRQNKGSIVASYDENGKILNTFERFVDVALPYVVTQAIYKEYPGWTVKSNIYRVSYYHNKAVKKVYQIQITKKNLTLNLKVDADGNILKQKAPTL